MAAPIRSSEENAMYRYDSTDRQIIRERAAQYRSQIERNLAGTLSDDELRPLRLQNGLYIQRHGPMLRIAIPYGQISSAQLRKLADISRRYDRAVGHFTTRQNLQLNWPKFEETPAILAELTEVDMHAIQTSGNCIRNVTTDKFAGVAPDELADPRPYCEIIRQWSTFHPEFAVLPRKFKIAVSGSVEDRAVIRVHDVGLELAKGRGLEDVLAELGHVAEGVSTAREVARLAAAKGIDMPISEAVDTILSRGERAADVVERLLSRDPKVEGV